MGFSKKNRTGGEDLLVRRVRCPSSVTSVGEICHKGWGNLSQGFGCREWVRTYLSQGSVKFVTRVRVSWGVRTYLSQGSDVPNSVTRFGEICHKGRGNLSQGWRENRSSTSLSQGLLDTCHKGLRFLSQGWRGIIGSHPLSQGLLNTCHKGMLCKCHKVNFWLCHKGNFLKKVGPHSPPLNDIF